MVTRIEDRRPIAGRSCGLSADYPELAFWYGPGRTGPWRTSGDVYVVEHAPDAWGHDDDGALVCDERWSVIRRHYGDQYEQGHDDEDLGGGLSAADAESLAIAAARGAQ